MRIIISVEAVVTKTSKLHFHCDALYFGHTPWHKNMHSGNASKRDVSMILQAFSCILSNSLKCVRALLHRTFFFTLIKKMAAAEKPVFFTVKSTESHSPYTHSFSQRMSKKKKKMGLIFDNLFYTSNLIHQCCCYCCFN